MRNLWMLLLPACWALASHMASGGVRVDGDRIIAETRSGRVVFVRGVVAEMTNRLTGETYTLGQQGAQLTCLRWRGSAAWIGAGLRPAKARHRRGDDPLSLPPRRNAIMPHAVPRGPNAARIRAALPGGHQVEMTVAIDPATVDVVVRQSGSTPRKGLAGIQWGIGGLYGARVRTLVPGHSGLRLDDRFPQRDFGFQWPGGWEVQFVAVEGERGGFAVWTHDTAMRFKMLRWRRRAGQVSLAFETHNDAPFDELVAVESVEWRIAFFQGDWRVPARRYRDWMAKTYRLTRLAAQQPAWVKDIRFVVIMGLGKDVLTALAKKVRPSATLLYIPGWRRDRYDVNYPDYTARDGFADFVRTARRMGFHVMPHMNYFGCDPKHPLYERFQRWHMRASFTKEHVWWIPPRERRQRDVEPSIKFAYINPASKAWREELVRRLVEAQKRYGFDAIHLDQTIAIYNDANGPIDGLRCAQGNLLLHKQLREALPDVALSGEGLNEVTCRYEAFAQRHALGIDHVYGTWHDAYIASAHPISSYFLTPVTKIYGYLGMSSPVNRGLYLAWKRAYESWGVLPTYAWPTAAQIQGRNAAVQVLLREARLWVDGELVPDFAQSWPPQTKFRLRGTAGATVVYESDGRGGSQMLRVAHGTRELVDAFGTGRGALERPGTIAGWYAYNEKKLFGLNPETHYVYTGQPRDLRAAHIAAAPDGVLVRVLMRDEHKFLAEFLAPREAYLRDLIKRLGEAETGIVVDGQRTELDHGGDFHAIRARCAEELKRAIHAHPPWRIRAKGPVPARTFGRFRVELPKDRRAFLEFAIGLRDGVDGRSDGVRFLIEVESEAVFDEVWAKSQWKEVSLPLDKWRGQTVNVAFITTPGPKNDPSFDWAVWGEPRVRLEIPRRRIAVRFASPRAVGFVVGTDPKLASQHTERGGMHLYDVSLTMPGRALFVWATPRKVKLPLDLAAEPFTISLSIEDTPATPPILHAGAAPGSATSRGIKKQGINAHPPNRGRTSIDYLLALPDKRPLTLSFAVGLRDGSESKSVLFLVEANGREIFRRKVTAPDGWHPAEVDLSAYAGKAVLLSLVVDADGPHHYDWATWAEPALR